jgi:hypothetical protein
VINVFSRGLSGKTVFFALALVALCLWACSQQDKATGGVTPPVAQDAQDELETSAAGKDAALNDGQKGDSAAITQWSIAFSPDRPTASDVIKAIIKSNGELPSDLSCKYAWEVNNRLIENVTGDSLSNQYFKKKDIVRVMVKISAGEKDASYKSNAVRVSASRPSLEINILSSDPKDSVVMKLSGKDPDGVKLTYALESPVPEGMEMNAEAGTISWKIPRGFMGNVKFQVLIVNSEGEKFIKSFEISASDKKLL